jgi:hypothetical protein
MEDFHVVNYGRRIGEAQLITTLSNFLRLEASPSRHLKAHELIILQPIRVMLDEMPNRYNPEECSIVAIF